MNQASNYFTVVQAELHALGQSVVLTDDERDIVDNYEAQQFGVRQCEQHICEQRK